MNSVSKLKIVFGYVLLLAVLIFTLLFVRKEVETLTLSDDQDVQWTDSLLTLLREKDKNTIRLLRTLSEVSEAMISSQEIEHIIAEQDTQVLQHRVQRRVITHRDTVVTPQKKKGFFRRLGEVFVPPKKDSSIQVKTSLEFAVDTVIDAYNPVDSLQRRLRAVAEKKRADSVVVRRRNRMLQRLDKMLTVRIDSVLKNYEQEALAQAQQENEKHQQVRRRSVRTIGWVAGGGVLLSTLFLALIVRDVTRSNRYRRQLEEARKQAEDLLATREKLMLAITHDFKAPLGSIMGYADLLSRLTVDERQRFYLDNMKNSSEHLLKLVVDLLDFHRLDLQKTEVHRVSFYPARLLEEIRTSFEPLVAAKGLSLSCQIAPSLNSAYISDPLRLRQIITNLLSNALKFTDRGEITMKAHYIEGKLEVAIVDTGKGMASADQERIFQEFTRLPGAQGKEGFGLGLSIVRMLVQLLEGKIKVDSQLDVGSTFTVLIPIYPVTLHVKSQEQAISKPASLSLDGNKAVVETALKRVVLIDDDRIQLTLTSAMLLHSGIDSVACLQVDELLNALRTQSFDVLLSDVQMPAISGFDLLQLLRASNLPQAKTIPVIAVTARSDMQRDEFLQAGFAGCLHKPFTVKELLQELGEYSSAPSSVASESLSKASSEPLSGRRYDFSALTAFTDDDAEAAASILDSFTVETRVHEQRLRHGLEVRDMEEISAVAHKMLPLVTLIQATELVGILKQLEAARGTAFTDDTGRLVEQSLVLIAEVLAELESNRC